MKLSHWEVVEEEEQVVEEEVEVGEEMEASLLPEAKMNPEQKEGQEEVGEAEVVAVRGKVEGGQRPTDGMKPNNYSSRWKRRMESAKALGSQLLAASGAFCHEGSQAGEGGELGEDKMAVEAAPPG